MKTSTAGKRNGIQWTLWKQLDDLDFADDLALLSHTQKQMQDKTSTIAETSISVGLNIHKRKSKVLKVNTSNPAPIILEGSVLEEVDHFTYLGSIVDLQGGTDADVRCRIGKARAAFLQLKNIWHSRSSPEEPKSASSTVTSNRSFSMELKHDEPPTPSTTRSRRSSIGV